MIVFCSSGLVPQVTLDPSDGFLELRGILCPENPVEYFESLKTVWEKTRCARLVKINLKLLYINSSALKCLISLFRLIEQDINQNNLSGISINWYYDFEDEDMLETINEMAELTSLQFRLIAIQNSELKAVC